MEQHLREEPKQLPGSALLYDILTKGGIEKGLQSDALRVSVAAAQERRAVL